MEVRKFDYKVLFNHFRDPIWQFWGVIATLIALVGSTFITYDIFYRGRTYSELIATIKGKYTVLGESPEYIDNVEIFFRGKKAKQVSSLYVDFQNSGNTIIRPEDYVKPIIFHVLPPSEIAGVEIIARTPSSLDISITNIFSNTFELSKSLLNPDDRATLRITLIDDPDFLDNSLSYEGRIAGIEDLKILREDEQQLFFTRLGFRFPFWGLFIIAVVTPILLYLTLFALRRKHSDYLDDRYAEGKIVLIAGLTSFSVGYFFVLVGNIWVNGSERWWSIWHRLIYLGGAIVILYLIFLARKLRVDLFVKRHIFHRF